MSLKKQKLIYPNCSFTKLVPYSPKIYPVLTQIVPLKFFHSLEKGVYCLAEIQRS